MTNSTRFLMALVWSATVLPFTSAVNAGIDDDNFDDGVTSSLWFIAIAGNPGPSVDEANGSLEVLFPKRASNSEFGIVGGYTSTCRFTGDFDVQVSYSIPSGLTASGVRIGLIAADGLGSGVLVERVSFGDPELDFPGEPREVYLMHFAPGPGVVGIIETDHVEGQLRLKRRGGTYTGYYLNEMGQWVVIYEDVGTTVDVAIKIHGFSDDAVFTNQATEITFDDYVVNQGQSSCGACCFGGGVCQLRTETSCAGFLATTYLDGGSCDDCPPLGACCWGGGVCQLLTKLFCEANLGTTYQGNGFPCGDCPPRGACCFGDGVCQRTTEVFCATNPAFTYLGDDSSCNPPPEACAPNVLICHNEHVISVAESAVPAHLAHGDCLEFVDDLGSCACQESISRHELQKENVAK